MKDATSDGKGSIGLTTLSRPAATAIIDLIFVHGLGGGSRSTWTGGDGDPTLFWPGEWLPRDDAFRDVRVHTFGYTASWKQESTLNIHDFAKSLLGSIEDCPAIPVGEKVPLIFVGHSMGGLVIKRAFNFASQFQGFRALAERFHTIFFLATPHRGSDLAQILNRVLTFSGIRPFVHDLQRNSILTQSINDEFPQHCQKLRLFSFYETVPMSYTLGKKIVVEKESATLGYANERAVSLNANHRDVARFTSMSDPNYIAVRNALASTVEKLRSHLRSNKHHMLAQQKQVLEAFLGVSGAVEDDYIAFDALRLPDSCEWIVKQQDYSLWRESAVSQIYWLMGKPAAGKSVLSSYIISNLKESHEDCCFHFFSHSDKASSTIQSFFRSMAWQMATLHQDVLDKILDIANDWRDDPLGKIDYNMIWRRLYLSGILKVKLNRMQHWILDGLDECRAETDLISFLIKIQEFWPVCIFVTSRNRFPARERGMMPKTEILHQELSESDTKKDIMRYIDVNSDALPAHSDTQKQLIAEKILDKSNGCFLWVKLVLHELRQVHLAAEVHSVLEDVPSDMDRLYLRILDSMSRAAYGKTLAKAILTWTVCAARPLASEEMHAALEADIADKMDNLEGAIATCCGQLVYIDQKKRVQMVHLTAREFLTGSLITSEFWIDKKLGHKRLAMACLRYLSGPELRGPRHRKLSVGPVQTQRSQFVAYAANHLFDHVQLAPSDDEELLAALSKLLSSSNILSWIEYVAQQSRLQKIVQAGLVLHTLLRRRAHDSPARKEIAMLTYWSTDLSRIATKFGKQLLSCPSSIFDLIPPFCPPESALRKQFAPTSTRGIAILGLSTETWDDCASILHYPKEMKLSTIASMNGFFAIGKVSGKIDVYDELTCQITRTLNHGENVMVLQFCTAGSFLVSAGPKRIRLWESKKWTQVHEFDVPARVLAVSFADEDRLLLAALRNNVLLSWDLSSGFAGEPTDWTEEYEGLSRLSYRAPLKACFHTQHNLLGVVYRGEEILLWDCETSTVSCRLGKEGIGMKQGEGSSSVWSLTFSPAPNATLLAAAYSDGDLVLFDSFAGDVVAKININAQTIAASPDGRFLALGDSGGTIHILEFETLKYLARIRGHESGIKALAFSADSRRLLDIHGSQCRAWDPPVLLTQSTEDSSSDTTSLSSATQDLGIEPPVIAVITALSNCYTGNMFACGRDDGTVWLFRLLPTELRAYLIFTLSTMVPISHVLYDSTSKVVSCTDASSRVISRRVTADLSQGLKCGQVLLDYRAKGSIRQLLSNERHTRLLVSTTEEHVVWEFDNSSGRATRLKTLDFATTPGHWMPHPLDSKTLVLLVTGLAKLYDWTTFGTARAAISLAELVSVPSTMRRAVSVPRSDTIITEVISTESPTSKPDVLLWSARELVTSCSSIDALPQLGTDSAHIDYIIGVKNGRVVYLNSAGWICSEALPTHPDEMADESGIVRHFFLPGDWLSNNHDLFIELTASGDVIFVKRTEVAVIRRGLEYTDQGASNVFSRRSSAVSWHTRDSRPSLSKTVSV